MVSVWEYAGATKPVYSNFVAAADLFTNPGLQNGDSGLLKRLWMLKEPKQPERITYLCCSCSIPVRCAHAHGRVSFSHDVVGDVKRHEGSASSRSDVYRWAQIRVS